MKDAQERRIADDLVIRAQRALRERFTGAADAKGYTSSPEANLLSGIDFAVIEDDLRRGDGNELETKFRAVYSSSALAVNSFGRFKSTPGELLFLGQRGADELEFEKRLRIFRGGRPPNLDVWIRRGTDVVAVESKCLEYLKPKVPMFSPAYNRLAPPRCDQSWWRLYQEVKLGAPQYLDRAQLVKHYFGIHAFQRAHTGVSATLVYLFWEPLNWQDVSVCVQHRAEIDAFATAVFDSPVALRWMSYNELWRSWQAEPSLADHVGRLQRRYQVNL